MRCIALDFYDRPLAPENMHDGFCFLDERDVQHGPTFPDIQSAVAWLCEQDNRTVLNIQMVPEKVLGHE